VETNDFYWTFWDSRSGQWTPRYKRWYWSEDIPLIVDLDGDGFDSHIAYRPRTGDWIVSGKESLNGPKLEPDSLSLPVVGRFLDGSACDLGVWSGRTGTWHLQSLQTGNTATFRHGQPGDILVPGDYDGDGYDEAVAWRRNDQTWYRRHATTGATSRWKFGSLTGIPLPADYDGDGRLDLAYWEPREGKIFVSYTLGRSVDNIILLPPHALPAFVNMY
jgi:hypothetical protein